MNLHLELVQIVEIDDRLTLKIQSNGLKIQIEELYFNKEIINIESINYGEIIGITIDRLYRNYIKEDTSIELEIRVGRGKRLVAISNPNIQYINEDEDIKVIDINVDSNRQILIVTFKSKFQLDKNFEMYLVSIDYPDYKSSIETIIKIGESLYNVELSMDILDKTCFSTGAKIFISNGKGNIYLTKYMFSNDIVLNLSYMLNKNEIYTVEVVNSIFYIKKNTKKMIQIQYINTIEDKFYVEITAVDEINLDDYKVVLVGVESEKEKYIPLKKTSDVYSFEVGINDIKTIEDIKINIRLYHIQQQRMVLLYSNIKRFETLIYTPLTEGEDIWEIGYKQNQLAITYKEKIEVVNEAKNGGFKKLPLKLKVKYSIVLVYSIFIYLISRLVKNRKAYSNIWLVGEMDDTAQDNGYHFFKYIRINHPEIDCYYLLNKDSVDMKNIEYLGNIIYRKSFKHILYLFLAKKHIGTHDYRHWHYPGYSNAFDRCFHNKIKGEFIQLQHGIMHIRSERGFHYDEQKYYNKIVVSSEKERDLLKGYFKHPEENLIITGLARYDNLIDTSQENKIITIMPTWRKGLREKNFSKSNYYEKWMEILKNPYLNQVLEDNDIILQFYLHIKLQPYTDLFEVGLGNNIKILKHGEKTVQDILKESNLLITDYSSVSLDFVYMKKPVIFYQFDYLSYLRSYAVLDWDEYKRSRFGFIGNNSKDVVSKIVYYINNGFKLEDEYIDISNQYFKYRDTNNCKRIFEAIK